MRTPDPKFKVYDHVRALPPGGEETLGFIIAVTREREQWVYTVDTRVTDEIWTKADFPEPCLSLTPKPQLTPDWSKWEAFYMEQLTNRAMEWNCKVPPIEETPSAATDR
ncbi:MAG: hypothetical protein EOP84_00560 [Verrucomicrobiaceae bacterium]|nr:MAG: hypothetical protein EOP84_00560 [Verrucomicrobiaceae bacterium]